MPPRDELLDRRALRQRIDAAVHALAPGTPLALMRLTLKGLRHALLGDACGAALGVQADVALALRDLAADCGGFAALLGPEDFALFVPGTESKEVRTLAVQVQERVIQCVGENLPGCTAHLGFAIGFSSLSQIRSLFCAADDALHRAIARGETYRNTPPEFRALADLR